MKIECWMVGKTQEAYLDEGIRLYQKRLRHYLPFETVVLPDVRLPGKSVPDMFKEKEGEQILKRLRQEDGLILLDERGKSFASVAFAEWLDRQLHMPYKRIIFQIGGAFGFSHAVYARANAMISLSEMTFSHQMVRLFLLEQLYRAMTILRNEPYHNEG